MANEKVIVGMSGGVDSSVAAYLLLQQGYDVSGLFMKNWADDEDCPATQDLADAKAVCAKLNIPLYTVNFSQRYWDNVFKNFLDEYAAGRTPNPDILCNKEIKFKAFLDYACENLQADYIATGHYVRKRWQETSAKWQLIKAIDENKDQSYFLYTLAQHQLAKSLFPIGDYSKSEIRQIAAAQDFITHDKKDSTGICFIGERRFKTFLSQYLLANPGDIVDEQNQVIGQHDGLMYYTIGQRQGLGIGGLKDHQEIPWYVIDKDIKHNRLLVAQGHEHPLLLGSTLLCNQLHWHSENTDIANFTCHAKIRYRQIDQECLLNQISSDCYRVTFSKPQRAITPGQSIVFYDDQQCLGGAIIIKRGELCE